LGIKTEKNKQRYTQTDRETQSENRPGIKAGDHILFT